jgi:hypothetical protein
MNLSALKAHPATLLIAASTFTGVTKNRSAWRGAGGSGICRESKVPLHRSTNENERWRVAMTDQGNSNPIVWWERVFITQAVNPARGAAADKGRVESSGGVQQFKAPFDGEAVLYLKAQ